MLLAGRPLMLLPIFLEQGLMAHAVCGMGAGAQAPAANPEGAVAGLEKFVAEVETYGAAARVLRINMAGMKLARRMNASLT
jgi:hypothetical protein